MQFNPNQRTDMNFRKLMLAAPLNAEHETVAVINCATEVHSSGKGEQ